MPDADATPSVTSNWRQRLRTKLGAIAYDLPRTMKALRGPGGLTAITNRTDQFDTSTDPFGIRVRSGDTSTLHLCDAFPRFAAWMLRRTMRDWKFEIANEIQFAQNPQVSFVIPHRGIERLPILESTIRSIASLPGEVECIVVEQDETKRLASLPANVIHRHLPHPEGDVRWHKCFAFNEGVKVARAPIVVCHDGDLLVPHNYLAVIEEHLVRRKQDVVYPQRFLYYLSKKTTETILTNQTTAALASETPEMVKQNWTGGTLAITKQAFDRVGGFDESFTGWTGEDREFYDRCHELNGWFFGYVPFLHLWHAPQSGRVDLKSRQQATEFTRQKLSIERSERIRMLRESRLAKSP